MGFNTDWFIADEAEAGAIAVSESPFDDWPCLSMKGIGEMELMELWGILRNVPPNLETVARDLLFQDPAGEMFVCRVVPGFIDALAAVKNTDVKRVAAVWGKTEGLEDWKPADIERVLREMCDFAMRAQR